MSGAAPPLQSRLSVGIAVARDDGSSTAPSQPARVLLDATVTARLPMADFLSFVQLKLGAPKLAQVRPSLWSMAAVLRVVFGFLWKVH